MLEAGIELVDRLIQLIDRRRTGAKEYFELYVEPSFSAAEAIYGDFLEVFGEVRQRITVELDVQAVIAHLEDGRRKHLALRAKLRAITRKWIMSSRTTGKFESGIVGVLRGGLAPFEDVRELDLSPYGNRGTHTMLDVLYYLSQEPLRDSRDDVVRILDRQQSALEKAWEDVVEGYAEHKERATR